MLVAEVEPAPGEVFSSGSSFRLGSEGFAEFTSDARASFWAVEMLSLLDRSGRHARLVLPRVYDRGETVRLQVVPSISRQRGPSFGQELY